MTDNTVTSEALKVWIQHSLLYKCLDLEVDSLWESKRSPGLICCPWNMFCSDVKVMASWLKAFLDTFWTCFLQEHLWVHTYLLCWYQISHSVPEYKQAFIVLSCARMRNVSLNLIQFGFLCSYSWYSLNDRNNGQIINLKQRFHSQFVIQPFWVWKHVLSFCSPLL